MATITMFDTIASIPDHIEKINEQTNMLPGLKEVTAKLNGIKEIYLIGSGTSDTAARTAKNFMTRILKLPVRAYTPSEFKMTIVPKNETILYLFISQTGSSQMTIAMAEQIQAQGYLCFAMTESAETILANKIDHHIPMGSGIELFPTRTLGYTTTAFSLMTFAMELAQAKGMLSAAERKAYQEKARNSIAQQRKLIPQTMAWLDKSRRRMLRSNCLIFVTSEEMIGVAKEAAMKIWEIPQIPALGYEIEESLHGPNYGYTPNDCVLILNDDPEEEKKYLALARYMKDIKNNGFVIGEKVVDQEDLQFSPANPEFRFLEFSIVIQVLAYRLALDGGRDLISPHDNSVMYSYFTTHEGD